MMGNRTFGKKCNPALNKQMCLAALLIFIFLLTFSARAEVYLENKLQMYFDYLGDYEYKKIILPKNNPEYMYLSYIHLNYVIDDFNRIQKSIGTHYTIKEKFIHLSKNQFPASFSIINNEFLQRELNCQPYNAKVVTLFHKQTQQKLKFCYTQELNKIHSYSAFQFFNARIQGQSVDKANFVQFLQSLAPASQFYSTFRSESNFPLNKLEVWKDDLPFDRKGLWFIEKYILPEFKETIYVPVNMPSNYRFSYFGFHFRFPETGMAPHRHLGFRPNFVYEISIKHPNGYYGQIRFDTHPIKKCPDFSDHKYVTRKFRSRHFGNFMVCTNQINHPSEKPNQKYNHHLLAPDKSIQMSGHYMSLQDFTQIVDRLRPLN